MDTITYLHSPWDVEAVIEGMAVSVDAFGYPTDLALLRAPWVRWLFEV